MFFMVLGIAAWFLYDGYILWPKEGQRYAVYTEIRDNLIESGYALDETSTSVRLAWERHSHDAGHRRTIPKERTDPAIREQRVIGWTMMTGVLFFAVWIAWNHQRKVRVEGETIIGASGERVELNSIHAIDRKKWKSKGIAYALYIDGKKERRLTLDDHKFAGCEVIISEVEKRILARAGEES